MDDEKQQQAFIQNAMMNPQVLQQVNALPEAERANFLRQLYQDYAGIGAANTEAMSQADMLRSGGAPEGVQAGNQFVAASPLSHLARGMNQYTGNREYKAAQEKQRQLSEDQTAGRSTYAGMVGGINPRQKEVADKLRLHGLGGR